MLNIQISWSQFLEFIQKKITPIEYQNWFAPIKFIEFKDNELFLEVPNIFLQQYVLDNYKNDLILFFTMDSKEPVINFHIAEPKNKKPPQETISKATEAQNKGFVSSNINRDYTFDNFIEGPSNQFVKSAALGIAQKPGKSFNPLFIHGGVGLGKTHLLHGIANFTISNHRDLSLQCITTEAFINDLVAHLRNKSVDKMKRFYRNIDVLLVDDIQFLQNRLNFEEEFSNTFEALINQNKQVVIASDKPPAQLKLSERMVARMEWGLVAQISIPDLETRVAILQHKAAIRGLSLSSNVAFFIAEHIFNNIRQMEGAINRLCAFSKLMNKEITEEIAEKLLNEMLEFAPQNKISVETILKSVANIYELRVSDLKGESRLKNIALARQVAMYLAKELISDSLIKIASSFGGKTHSTLLHAWKKISEELKKDELLSRQIQMIKRHIETQS